LLEWPRPDGTWISSKRARATVSPPHGGLEEEDFAKFSALLQYVDGDYREAETFVQLRRLLGQARRPLHYLAIPPSMFAAVAEGLAQAGLASEARVVVEKPLGAISIPHGSLRAF